MQVQQCITILQKIIDYKNFFPSDHWNEVPKTSVGMYTKCLSILRENGLISKKDGHYTLSTDLSIALEKIAERWKELTNTVEREEKITLN